MQIQVYFNMFKVLVIQQLLKSLPYKRSVWLAIKPGLTHICFLKCSIPSLEYGSCYQIVRFYYVGGGFCGTSVFLSRCFSIKVFVFFQFMFVTRICSLSINL